MLSGKISCQLFLVAFVIMLLNITAVAQNRDAGLWTSVSFEAKLIKKLTGSISQEVRFNENMTEMGTSYSDAGIEYKVNKNFNFSVNYRFVQKRRTDDSYSYRHRVYIDLKYGKKIKPFQIQLRTRLQDQYSDIGRAADGGVAGYYLRNRLSLKWDTKKVYVPYISIEVFSPLNFPRYAMFDNIRSSAGVEFELSKHHKLDLFYMIQKELNVSLPRTDFILGAGYSFKL